jgi:DNA-binding CsgD family transcriptional regulator
MVRRSTAQATTPDLSARELEVLYLLAEGLRTSEISRRLYMSDSTTKTHIAHIYQKLDASNRAQAMVTAMRLGLIDGATRSA